MSQNKFVLMIGLQHEGSLSEERDDTVLLADLVGASVHDIVLVVEALVKLDDVDDELIFKVINLITHQDTIYQTQSMKSMFQTLRSSSSAGESSNEGAGVFFRDNEITSMSGSVTSAGQTGKGPNLPIRFHKALLDALAARLQSDSPSHIKFAGEKDSFLSVPNAKIVCPKEYTIAMWVNVSSESPSKGFLLYRARTNTGGIDVIASDRQQDMTTWFITLRSYLGNQGLAKAKVKEETKGLYIQLVPDQWHLITVRHVNAHNYLLHDHVTIAVDGVAVVPMDEAASPGKAPAGRYSNSVDMKPTDSVPEDESAQQHLVYPFRGQNSVESQWVFALGMRGKVYNICLYNEPLNLERCRVLYRLGKYTPHFARGVSVPQLSFDSGYLVLGSQHAKGVEARRACKYSPEFCITADAFSLNLPRQAVENFPQIHSGRLSVDHVIMTQYSPESTLTLFLNGNSVVCKGKSSIESCVNEGSVALALYLCWNYCSACNSTSSNHAKSKDVDVVVAQGHRERIISVLNVLVNMISSSVDLKEHFLQLHGFHLVSYCLMSINAHMKNCIIDSELVDYTSKLVRALGDDAYCGDGIASALQGLMLNFRVWGGDSPLKTRLHLLETICMISSDANNALYKYIGTQRVLDVYRLNIVRTSDNSNDPLLRECAHVGYRLLQNVLDSALQSALEDATELGKGIPASTLPPSLTIRKLYPGFPEVEMLIACLEESQSTLIVENILATLLNLRSRVPRTLLYALHKCRFVDTIAPNLFCKKGYDMKIRKQAMVLLLWYLSEDFKRIPSDLVKLRSYETRTLGTSTFKPNAGQKRHLDRPPPEDATENDKILWMRHELMLPVVHVWQQLHFLSQCIDKALNDGCWNYDEASYEDFLSVLTHDGSMPELKMWLVLPFLGVFSSKSRASVTLCQRILMGANVMLKTDQNQSEVLCTIPDQMWIENFIELANIGEAAAKATDDEALKAVASTCTELALDGLSTTLEVKTRLYCEESFESWSVLQALLARPSSISNEIIYLKRCVSLVLQRISRSGDEWNPHSISAVVNVIHLVENRHLAANWPVSAVVTNASPSKAVTDSSNAMLLDFNEDDASSTNCNSDKFLPYSQTQDERQIMCFIIDIMSGLRKAAANRALVGIEQYALRPGLRVLLGCLRSSEGDAADRLASEVTYQLSYMSESWGARNADDFRKFFMRVISQTRSALDDGNLKEEERGRYHALVYSFMHHFLDMRHTMQLGGSVAHHVIPTMDLLIGIDTCNDVNMIFDLVDVNFANTETISFADDSPGIFEGIENTISDIWSAEEAVLPSPPPEAQEVDLLGDAYCEVQKQDEDDNSPTSTVRSQAQEDEEDDKLMAGRSAQAWFSLRKGIFSDRVDTERTRLARSLHAIDSSVEATSKYWKKMRQKIETENFAERHKCEWKMGVAHEGSFPSRKRLVLRPRRLNKHNLTARARNSSASRTDASADDVGEKSVKELGKAMKSYIRDASADEKLNNNDKEASGEPGTGWGIVDADGSDEGFGVVGISSGSDSQKPKKTASEDDKDGNRSNPDQDEEQDEDAEEDAEAEVDTMMDVNGDMYEMDAALSNGRIVETGPAHAGSRRFGSGLPVYEAKVILITASGNVHGYLCFNEKEIFFASTQEIGDEEEGKQDTGTINLSSRSIRRRRWVLSAVSALYLRRFRLRDSALEVFFRRGKHRNFFVDFGHEEKDWRARDEFAKRLAKVIPVGPRFKPFLQRPTFGVPASALVRQHGVQDAWLAGKLTNFDYLMALNTIAGRSFNDLCQYPVMPWVIAQYKESTLDLSDPTTFRDLSKPMGALNDNRLDDIIERFECMAEEYETGSEQIPPFMYGSHYSTMVGVVLHFLVRLQPFASLHNEMQGGHFDVADRIFSSIPRTWEQNTTQLSEVKEITPEWFTTSEMFKNVNKFDFGETQEGETVDDVKLPPWASTAEEFVRLNRQALESDYVSEHLHEWIDLIFGFKQTGEAAEDAKNVFFYLTYYNAVDRSAIDENLRRQIELQISHFGQTPQQLFTQPHPAKNMKKLKSGNAFLSSSTSESNVSPRPFRLCFESECALRNDSSSQPSPSIPFQKNILGEYSSMMVQPRNLEEAASCNSKATEVFTPLREGATYKPAVCIMMHQTHMSCVLDTGVIEVLKFGTTKLSKQCVQKEQKIQKDMAKTQKANTGSDSHHGARTGDTLDGEAARGAIISFDEDFSPPSPMSPMSPGANLMEAREEKLFTLPVPMVQLEPDRAHFESLPRLLLPPCETVFDKCNIVIQSGSGNYALVGGYADGGVAVRGMDRETGYLKSSGDFNGHRAKVVSFASDSILDADTDVVASMDNEGHLLVWTISTINASGAKLDRRSIISRRPQRSFRLPVDHKGMSCDIVWQMGIVVAASKNMIYMFSVERDELLKALDMTIGADERRSAKEPKEFSSAATASQHGQVKADESGVADLLSFSNDMASLSSDALSATAYEGKGVTSVRKVSVCNDGVILMHLEYTLPDQPAEHYLAAQSLSGSRIKLLYCEFPVTFLDCPTHGNIAISGHTDGCVYIYDSQSLQVLYAMCAPLFCISQDAQTRQMLREGQRCDATAVVCVKVGPDSRYPAMLSVSTADGALYVKALPDYMKWERINSPSALSQVVNAPIKAVRSALQNASTLSSSVADNAGVFAHNVKDSVDDAIGKLTGGASLKSISKDIGNNSLVKGFSSFFGGRK